MISWESNLIVLDLETTSIKDDGRVIEIGAVKLDRELIEIDEFTCLVKPPEEISVDISNLTGITNDMILSAKTFNEVCPDFFKFVDNAGLMSWGNKDEIWLKREFSIAGREYPFKKRCIDLYSACCIYLNVQGYNASKYNLQLIADILEVPVFTPSHRALPDAKTTAGVLRVLRQKFRSI